MKILIVEDEVKYANNLKKLLTMEGYAVDVTYDGNSGYDLTCSNEYDLIILDIGLPGTNGLILCKKIRDDECKTPIIFLTAQDSVDKRIEGLDSGADDYLVKPFNFNELLARVRAVLRRNSGVASNKLILDTLEINLDSQKVTRSNLEVSLSAKEYSLLEYLMYNAGKIITKMDLIEHVWDSDLDPDSNVVDVYIGYLRNKIDKSFENEAPLIHTIKGRGYKISL